MACALFVALGASCGDGLVPSPFASRSDAGASDAGGELQTPSERDAGRAPPRPSLGPGEALGEPCVDDEQCDDGLDCTFDACDASLGACRFVADDTLCDDGAFCNGVEVCHPRLGCRAGPPTSCADSTPCTVDRCDEATRACLREPRDADGDGDVDANCAAAGVEAGDCNDLDPGISSQLPEVCANGRDDDCDGEVDETDCAPLRYDDCDDPLVIAAAGTHVLAAARPGVDLGASCAVSASPLRDFALRVEVPEGSEPRDVELRASSAAGQLWLARVDACGADAGSPGELACVAGTSPGVVPSQVRLRLPRLAPGAHDVAVVSTSAAPIELSVDYLQPTPTIDNVDCDSSVALAIGEPVLTDLSTGGEELAGACQTGRSERVFSLRVEQTSDLSVVARALDDLGRPRLSLRTSACDDPGAELTCRLGQPAELARRALEPGDYFVGVSSSGPSQVELLAALAPPTPPLATENCESGPLLLPGTETVRFEGLLDDVAAGCQPGAVDAARRLVLDRASDVMLVGRFSPGDVGAVSLAGPRCDAEATIVCAAGGSRPVRAVRHALQAGEYRVVVESQLGLPATITALVRPAAAPVSVPGADECVDALRIDASGGFFRGSTLNARADFSASCDFATPAGAPDQLLRFALGERRRVVLDTRGSDFDTLLNLRRGPGCPGVELDRACSVSRGGDRSFLDLELEAGEYAIQMDGYAGASGSWFLDVFSLAP